MPALAQDFRMKRFFKGVFSLRPSLAKYNVTWDSEVLLKFIRVLPEELNLENLTLKLASLLVLATGQRVQTLANIEINNIKKVSDGLVIKVSKRVKTSGPNKLQPPIFLHFFTMTRKFA